MLLPRPSRRWIKRRSRQVTTSPKPSIEGKFDVFPYHVSPLPDSVLPFFFYYREKLVEIEHKADKLLDQSKKFKKTSRDLEWKYCFTNYQNLAIIIIIVLVIVGLFAWLLFG